MNAWFRLLSGKVGLPTPVVHDVRCERRIGIPMADGARTLADRWTPVGVANAPLILVRSPYGRRLFNLLVGRYFAHQGFQVLIQSSRGTDGSEGRFDDPFGCEIDDGAATVRWLVKQSWYPGRFVTFGDSYLGYTQMALAPAARGHLAGAVLRVAPSSLYDMIWPGGALFLKALLGWSVMAQRDPRLGLQELLRERRRAPRIEAAGREAPLLTSYRALAREPIPFFEQWIQHPDRDDPWWDRFDVSGALDTITCPVLVQGGWYDLFLEDSISQYARLATRGVPVELNLGPWTHGDMVSKGLAASYADATAFLRDITGLDPRPASRQSVRLIEINSKDTLSYDQWPPPAGGKQTLHLAGGSRLADSPDPDSATVSYRYDPSNPTPSVGGANNDSASGPKDNTALEQRDDVLTFTSDPLPADLHVLGAPSVSLTFSSDRSDTAVFIRVCEVPPDGRSINVTDRLVLLRSSSRSDQGCWEVDVALPPTCIRISAGHRIRLQISSGAFPRFARHPGTAEPPAVAADFHPATQTVRYGGSSGGALHLPLRQIRAPAASAPDLNQETYT